jgi:hypothetical protein
VASLEERIRTAAANYAPLATLVGSGSPLQLRWYDKQWPQGSAFPGVTVLLVTNPQSYVFGGRLPTGWALVQFTIWGGPFAAGAASAESVAQALMNFLDQLDLVGNGRSIQQNHQVIGDRGAMFVNADNAIYQRVIEARMFSDSTK